MNQLNEDSMKSRRKITKIGWTLFIILLLGIISFNIPMPYYIMQPGTADVIRPMVEVVGGYHEEKGSFMLTTVLMGKANLLTYGYAKIDKDKFDIVPEDLLLIKGEDQDEYFKRERLNMRISQDEATLVAFHHANVPIDVKAQAAVTAVIKGMPAENVLQVGDIIEKIDGVKIENSNQLIESVKNKKAGDQLAIQYNRDGKENTVTLALKMFKPTNSGVEKPGIGIALSDVPEITPSKKVHVDTGKIGGPSAGLMFTLEIYNQLTKEDWTKGYPIAGTGTIDYAGNVGQIGGIDHKIVAADRAGAEIFFLPKDLKPGDDNQKVAFQKAKEIGTKMKLVPVATFEEALNYLRELSPKK